MPNTPTPPLTLEDRVNRFVVDSDLVHQFTKGDESVIVHGIDGDYPSLAKLASDSKKAVLSAVQALQGLVVHKYEFTDVLSLSVQHDTGAKHYDFSIVNVNGDTLLAPHMPSDDNNSFVVDFAEPESGVLIARFYTLL